MCFQGAEEAAGVVVARRMDRAQVFYDAVVVIGELGSRAEDARGASPTDRRPALPSARLQRLVSSAVS